ncbi:MAG: B12-binding domain-containing radical SAM protein [bacterium]
MSKILMLNPPFLPKYSRFSRSPAVTKSGTLYYPLWHAYATGVIEKEGHEVRLLDAPAEGLNREECYRIARDFCPQMVVLYTSTPSIYNDIEIGGAIKEIIPESFIVLTGPHVSALPEESLALDNRIDAVARGEYDMTLVDLAKVLPDKEGLDEVHGITVRCNDEIRTTPAREFIEDLDALPFVSSVYKKHLRIENYFYAHCRYPIVSFFTSRGCYARCTYCVYPQQMFGRKQRQRSPENIVAEFAYIAKELPYVKEVLIDDDTFSFDQEHTIKFCELMMEKSIKIPWTVECRANLHYETMVMMKKAGCRLIVIGFESADNTILKNVHKGLTVERMREFAQDAKRAGIMIHSCFMAGNRGETRKTLKESLAFAKEIGADTCQFFPLMVYPGTEAYEWAKENNYLLTRNFREWLTDEGLHNCVVSTPDLSAKDLVEFCDYARKKYYLSPKYLTYKLIQSLKAPQEMKKTVKSAKIFFKYLLRG